MLGKIKTTTSEFLASWPWQWFAHLTLPYQATESQLEKMAISWAREIAKTERIQVANAAAINSLRHPHLHLLMLGRSAKGKTLAEADRRMAAKRWPGDAVIRTVYDVIGAAKYLTSNMPRHNHQLMFYNIKLLSKIRAANS